MTLKQKKGKSKIKSNNIRMLLEITPMSQQELADIVGTNRHHISRLINQKESCVSLPIAMKIAKALRRPVEQVFILEDSNEKD